MNEADIQAIEYLTQSKVLEITFENEANIDINDVIGFADGMVLNGIKVYRGGKLLHDMVPTDAGWIERPT